MKSHLKIKFTSILFLVTLSVFSQVRLPQLISDGIVLQRDEPVKIWGWASPDDKITIHFTPKLSTLNS